MSSKHNKKTHKTKYIYIQAPIEIPDEKIKKKKDPSGWNIFIKENYQRVASNVINSNKKEKFGQVIKLLSDEYKALNTKK